MKKIRLSGINKDNLFTLVDDNDYDYLSQFKWYFDGRKIYRTVTIRYSLHREITKCPINLVVDHINHNPLDNTRKNLRICTHAQNTANSRKRRNSKSLFKGVKQKGQKWIARYRHKHLGTFDSIELAARAYNKAAQEKYGEYALLNKV
jgi:hypothetical protein